ncbi:hypothetical protein BV898_04127 [Hypsibius exemplaris]|uniref:Protein quiver n=1 Tax=Hypsibius exemplaris TaxID=2072580 RepID=A0A1W0X3M7_HYPEX|nr:hypothetical protein BV898_04127 [Hypsibius exemplaris]
MSRLLAVLATVSVLVVSASALRCYTCQHSAENPGACELDPFNTLAPGVSQVECNTSCMVDRSEFRSPNHSGGGPPGFGPHRIHVRRGCAEAVIADGCDTRMVPGQIGAPPHTTTLCTCNTNFCNTNTPVPAAQPTSPPPTSGLKCYTCGHHEWTNNGTCGQQPFNSSAPGVAVTFCDTSCETEKFINHEGQVHVRRACGLLKLPDGCQQIRPLHGPEQAHNFTVCTCSTDLCNTGLPGTLQEGGNNGARGPIFASMVLIFAALLL